MIAIAGRQSTFSTPCFSRAEEIKLDDLQLFFVENTDDFRLLNILLGDIYLTNSDSCLYGPIGTNL